MQQGRKARMSVLQCNKANRLRLRTPLTAHECFWENVPLWAGQPNLFVGRLLVDDPSTVHTASQVHHSRLLLGSIEVVEAWGNKIEG